MKVTLKGSKTGLQAASYEFIYMNMYILLQLHAHCSYKTLQASNRTLTVSAWRWRCWDGRTAVSLGPARNIPARNSGHPSCTRYSVARPHSAWPDRQLPAGSPPPPAPKGAPTRNRRPRACVLNSLGTSASCCVFFTARARLRWWIRPTSRLILDLATALHRRSTHAYTHLCLVTRACIASKGVHTTWPRINNTLDTYTQEK